MDKDVENEAILIDGAPEPMFLSGHRDDDFVEMPFIPTNRLAATNAIGEFPTEFLRPEANALIADLNAARGEHLPNHLQAVCAENLVRIDRGADPVILSLMIALIGLLFAMLVSPFKSRSRLEAENAALRQQLIVLRTWASSALPES